MQYRQWFQQHQLRTGPANKVQKMVMWQAVKCISTIEAVIIPQAKRGVYAIGHDRKAGDICTRS